MKYKEEINFMCYIYVHVHKGVYQFVMQIIRDLWKLLCTVNVGTQIHLNDLTVTINLAL